MGQSTSDLTAIVETGVANKLNTAIPGSPTADSVNQRIVAIDALTEASGNGDLAAMKTTLDAQSAGGGVPTLGD